ncbi:MAG: cytochrome c [SAR324 cluster bacterium]|nr:cytochrome c [SAR324 cluster bacterium]
MKIQFKLSCLVLFGVLLFLMPLQVTAADDKAAITYRVRVMKGIGANMHSIGDILKGKVDHKELIVHYAKALNETSKTVTTIFKQDTSKSKKNSRSKNAIWEKWGDFEKESNAFVKASTNMVKAAETGDMANIGPAMKKLGETCGDCHKPFREKKKKK